MQKVLLIILSTSFLFIAKSTFAEISLEPYCKDGYYQIPYESFPRENKCSRAPECGGKSYDEVERLPYDYNYCLGDGKAGRSARVYTGLVPLCCYEVARTGDSTKCVWTERYYCHQSQCDKVQGDKRNCGYSLYTWLGMDGLPASTVPYIPIEQRFGSTAPQPTATPTNRPSGPTPTTPAGSTPTPTHQAGNPTPQPTIPSNISPAPTNTPAPPVPTKQYSFHRFVFRPTNTPVPFPQQVSFQAIGQVIVLNENNSQIESIKVEIYKKGAKQPIAQVERVSGFFLPFLFADLNPKDTYYLIATVTTTGDRTYKQSNKCKTSSAKYRCLANPDSGALEIEVQTKDFIPRNSVKTAIIKALEAPKQAINIIQKADNNLLSTFIRIINSINSLIDL